MTDYSEEKQKRRDIVHRELVLFHGHPGLHSAWLPPMDYIKPKERLGSAWLTSDQSLRQMSNFYGARDKYLPGSAPPSCRRSFEPKEGSRHSEFISSVNNILTTSFDTWVPPPKKATKSARFKSAIAEKTMQFSRNATVNKDESFLVKPRPLVQKEVTWNLPLPAISNINSKLQRMPKTGTGKNSPRNKKSKKDLNLKTGMRRQTGASSTLPAEFNNVMRGLVTSPLPKRVPRRVRIVVTGHVGDDMKTEFNYLRENAFLSLKEWCYTKDIPLQIVHNLPFNNEFNMSEAEKCATTSIGPSLVCLLGDKFGKWRATKTLTRRMYDTYVEVAHKVKLRNFDLLPQCVTLDHNADPLLYCVQLPSEKHVREDLIELLYDVMEAAYDDGAFSFAEAVQAYQADVSNDILLGVTEDPGPNTNQVLFFLRNISGHTDNHQSVKYTDTVTTRTGETKAKPIFRTFVNTIKNIMIPARLPEEQFHKYDVACSGGRNKECVIKDEEAYLVKLNTNVFEDLKKHIEINFDKHTFKHKFDFLYVEVMQHLAELNVYLETFYGRKETLSNIETRSKALAAKRKPLIIHGKQDCRLSSLMAKVADGAKQWLADSCINVVRFFGITTESSDIRLLLVNITLQIALAYNLEPPAVTDISSPNKVVEHFKSSLELVAKWHAKERPLVIILEGMERVNAQDRANTFWWLPATTPANIYLILSFEESDTFDENILTKLKVRYPDSFEEIGGFAVDDMKSIIISKLEEKNRKLSDNQKEVIEELCIQQLDPIFACIMAERSLQWRSFESVQTEELPATLSDVVSNILSMLEAEHGEKLVKHFLMFLWFSEDGLTENELHDLLSCNREVLEEGETFPTIDPISMTTLAHMIHVLRHFIIERESYLQPTVHLRHGPSRKLILQRYGDGGAPKSMESYYCKAIADMYNNVDKEMVMTIGAQQYTSHVTPHPVRVKDKRLLKFLLSYTLRTGEISDTLNTVKERHLCNFTWIYTHLQCMPISALKEDIYSVGIRDFEIDFISDIITENQTELKLEPQNFAAQILGSLSSSLSPTDYKHVNSGLLYEAINFVQQFSQTLMVPVTQCFPSPMRMFKCSYPDIVEILTFNKETNLAVARNKDNGLEVWDIKHKEQVFLMDIWYDKLNLNVSVNDSKVIGLSDQHIIVHDIETGRLLCQKEISAFTKKNIASVSLFAVSDDFEQLALLTNDEEFNQAIVVVDLNDDVILTHVSDFDVKDEFYKYSAMLHKDNQLIYIHARSQEVSPNVSKDIIKLTAWDVKEDRYKVIVTCGEKKFEHLYEIKERETVVIFWQCGDCDTYCIKTGKHLQYIRAVADMEMQYVARTLKTGFFISLLKQNKTAKAGISNCYLYDVVSGSVDEIASVEKEQNVLPNVFRYLEEPNLLILACTNSADLIVWDVAHRVVIKEIANAHAGNIDGLGPHSDPYRFFSHCSEECLVKEWDLFRVETLYRRNQTSLEEAIDLEDSHDYKQHVRDVEFSADGTKLIVCYDNGLPVLCNTEDSKDLVYFTLHGRRNYPSKDASFALDDKVIVALVDLENNTDEDIIHPLMQYTAWDRTERELLYEDTVLVSAMTLLRSKDAVMTVGSPDETSQGREIEFRLLSIKDASVQWSRRFESHIFTPKLQLSSDELQAVLNEVSLVGTDIKACWTFNVDPKAKYPPDPKKYHYEVGGKYKKFKVTQNVILKKGLAMLTGLNGDLQLWDINTAEYESNLYQDSSVKDTRNPSLHNYGGHRINHLTVSSDGVFLICSVQSGELSVWNLETELLVNNYKCIPKSEATCAVISQDNKVLVSCHKSGYIHLWEFGVTSCPITSLNIHGVASHVTMDDSRTHLAIIAMRRNEPNRLVVLRLQNVTLQEDSNRGKK